MVFWQGSMIQEIGPTGPTFHGPPNLPEHLIALASQLTLLGVRWDSVPFNLDGGL